MIHSNIRGKVVETLKIKSSKESNPRFKVKVKTENGVIEILKTSPNAIIGYAIDNREYSDDNHTFYLDKNGEIVGASRLEPRK